MGKTMNVLDEICARKREHIATRRIEMPLAVLEAMITKADKPRGFIGAIRRARGPAIIAEIKKASPSRGIIRAGFDPASIAKTYESNGATCLSVLTDEPYFQGSDNDLRSARAASALPVLRKDFILDPYQVYESRALGADCILLIMAALDDNDARNLYDLARDLGMDVLVEVHDEAELKRAIQLGPEMIGINNRNLQTLEVNVETSRELGALMPGNFLKISESGIEGNATVLSLQEAGFDGFLVGESLLRKQDIGVALRGLLTQTRN